MTARTTWLRGNPIYVVKRFFDVDPITQTGPLTNPDAVTFIVSNSDDEDTSYVWHVDPEVSNPSEGVFLLSLDPQTPAGGYRWRCESSGTGLIAAEEGAFDVVESGVLDPDQPVTAIPGPCQSWINGDDVVDYTGPIKKIGSDTYLLDDFAYAASSLLYSLTARQFPGVCELHVRPCNDPCGHWDRASGMPWYWGYWSGAGVNPIGWYWWNGDGVQMQGCDPQAVVRLAGYPVREVTEVKIGGVVLPEFDIDTGARNWQLQQRRQLVRFNVPNAGNPQPRYWPGCQDMRLEDDQPGTFSVKYRWGSDVPVLGRMAAAQLARELWNALNGESCALPGKVTKVVRQGVTMERVVAIAEMLRSGSTGLQLVDSFIADVNPTGAKRRSAVFTPDVRPYGRRVGP